MKVLLSSHFGVTIGTMRTLTIKLKHEQDAWLEKQARLVKRSKGAVIRELISHQQAAGRESSLAEALADLCGSVAGSRDLSARSLKGYGRR
jgi:hypothetical protein